MLFQESIRAKEEEHQRMQQRLKTLQDQVNLYRTMLPSSSDVTTSSTSLPPRTLSTDSSSDASASTPVTSPRLASPSKLGAASPPVMRGASGSDALFISETQQQQDGSRSRPVSTVSMTSEKSVSSVTSSDDAAVDVDEVDDDMLRTLTAQSLSKSCAATQLSNTCILPRSDAYICQ